MKGEPRWIFGSRVIRSIPARLSGLHVSDRLSAIADRYFSRAVAATVTFGRGPYEDFTCDIVAPVNRGAVLKSSNRANDAHIAFDGAADKIEKQLKRYMDRLRDRRG